MANTNLTIDMVTRECQRIAHEKTAFIGTTDLQYDKNFAIEGGKIGSALRVRYPDQFTRTQGSRVLDVQNAVERAGTITLATQDHVGMRFNGAELSLSLDELSKRKIEPAMAVLMSGIEADYIAFCTKATYQVANAAAAGTPPSTLAAVGAARAKLNRGLAPKDGNRYIQYDSVNMATMVSGLSGLFQDSTQIKEQYREGMLGRTAMADWYENDRMWAMTNGSDVTGTTGAAALVTDGGLSSTNGLVVDISATVAVAVQVIGQVFTIAGVFDCHPETKQSYGTLKQFTITAIGASLTSISPQIVLTGPRQNVCSSLSAQLLTTDFNSQTLTFVGAASTSYVQNLMYHKEAFQFVTADLPLMGGSDKCVRRVQDGISLRVWQDSDIRNDELLMRIDILYGFAALRPEWACRITM
jgi:hypothetical protein